MLAPSTQAEILRLHFAQKLSRRMIAKVLGIQRNTVASVICRRQVHLQGRPRSRRETLLDPYRDLIDKLLGEAPMRSAVNVLQHLRTAGYKGSVSILRCYLRVVRPPPAAKAFTMLQFLSGQAAQIDWGEFGDIFLNGTKVHVFVMVLCFSRMLYLEFTQRETLPTLLRCYERALSFFGGACQEHWHDNMPTVVVEHHGHLVRFTESFLAYAGFRHFKPIACHVGAGHEKGRVEDGVKLVRHQFWPGRHFDSLEDLNQQARVWRDTFANRREHAATKKIPELLFESERKVLLPLDAPPYDTDDIVSTGVNKFFRVPFEGNTYSVPWTLVGKSVTVRADDKYVHIFYGPKCVAKHAREYRKQQTLLNPAHEEGLKERRPCAEATWDLKAVSRIGPNASRYLELITAGGRSIRREVKELLCLATVYGADAVEKTVGELLQQGIVGAEHVERLLRLNQVDRKAPPPLELSQEKLSVVLPAPQLEVYDTLLGAARCATNDEKTEESFHELDGNR
jgi:transposase